jgi:hypothetical protein
MLQTTLTTSTAGQNTEARPADEQQYGGLISMYLGWQRAAAPSCAPHSCEKRARARVNVFSDGLLGIPSAQEQ